MEKAISKFHPRFLKPVQLWLEAFLKTSDHLVDQDTWGEFQVVTDSEFALVMK